MAFFRKAVMFAITTGLAKKAWDSYKHKNPVAAARLKADAKEKVDRTLHPQRDVTDVHPR